MDELARDTGGEALYNTNGLNDALDRVLSHGTHYYTITYSPTNKNMDGRLRHIEVKVSGRKLSPVLSSGLLRHERYICAAGASRSPRAIRCVP